MKRTVQLIELPKGILILILVVLLVWFLKKREDRHLKQRRITGRVNRFVMRVGCLFVFKVVFHFFELDGHPSKKGLKV